MNTYRVTFYANYRTGLGSEHKLASETLWVEARGEHHAVAEATMLVMGGTGNEIAKAIHAWLISGQIHNVYAVIETN